MRFFKKTRWGVVYCNDFNVWITQKKHIVVGIVKCDERIIFNIYNISPGHVPTHANVNEAFLHLAFSKLHSFQYVTPSLPHIDK